MALIEQKSSLMYKLMLGVQSILFIYLNPRLLALLIGKESISAKIFLILFLVCLNIFWFFGVYYLFMIIFSTKRIKKITLEKKEYLNPPPVAIFYVTKNDFQKKAVHSCINQDYKNFHIYILDDSTEQEYMHTIDDFAKNEKDITILRRKDKRGFKAGNLNFGLKNLSPEYEFIAIVDADEVIPKNFIRDLLGYFLPNKALAFIQANHLSHPHQETSFAKDMSLVNDIHWKYMVPSRNKYGFAMFYGHGAILRRTFLEEAGGFPEAVSEDLALSVVLRERGYYGYTDEDIVCFEDTPKDYLRYRKRHEKWVRGTVEFMKKYISGFLRCKKIPWFEKLDVLFLNASLFLPVPFFIFLLTGAFILPIFFSRKDVFSISLPFLSNRFFVYKYHGMASRFSGFWFWDFFIIILLSIFVQYIPVILELRKKPLKLWRYLKNSYTVSSGLTFITFVGFWGGLFSEKTYFATTGDEKDKYNIRGWLKGYVAEQKGVFLFEFILGILLLIVFSLTLNVWLFPVATSLLLSFFVYKSSWENKVIQYGMVVPFVSLVFILVLIVIFLIRADFPDIYSSGMFK